MRKLFLLLLIYSAAIHAWAERVNVSTAKQVATNVAERLNSTNNLRSNGGVSLVYTAPAEASLSTRSTSREADYYIFNVGNGNGFVIVSGEDRVKPILGYSATGKIDMDNMPDNMKAWLDGYQKEITWAVKQNITQSAKVEKEWSQYINGSMQFRAEGGVLLKTANWNQGEPYNTMCPMIGNERAVTGCVATSTAIVMRYHQYPTQANAEYGKLNYWQQNIEYTPYNWNKMPMEYKSGTYSEEEAGQVAALMWHIGANVDMQYSLTGSGATWEKLPSVLTDLFGYSKGVLHVYKEDYYWDDWKNMLKNELDNNRPVLYDGQSSSSGHAFVCDGYSPEGAFHFNWGWGGSSNGYFLLTTMDAYGDGDGYKYDSSMIIGIQKPQEDESDTPAFQLRQYSLSAVFPLSTDKAFNISSKAINRGNTKVSGYLNIAIADAMGNLLTNNDGNIKTIGASSVYISLEPNHYGGESITCMLSAPLEEGTMLVSVYSEDRDGKNGWIRLEGGPDVPIGLSMTEEIWKEDEANEPEITPVNLSTYWNQFDNAIMEVITDGSTQSAKNTKGISFNVTGLSTDAKLYFQVKDASWTKHLSVFYADHNDPLYKEGEGTTATIDNNGWWIDLPLNKIEDGAFVSYIKVLSDQIGTMQYDIILYSEDKILAKIENKSMTFAGEIISSFSPSPIKGELNKPIQFTWTPQNIPAAWIGKPATITFRLQNMSTTNTTLTYMENGKEVTLSCFDDGSNYLNVEIPLSYFDNTAYTFTLETREECPAELAQSIHISKIFVNNESFPVKTIVAAIQTTAPTAQTIDWSFNPTQLIGTTDLEFDFTIKATNVATEWIGKQPTLGLKIEGSQKNEVEMYYLNDKNERQKLTIIANPEWPEENQCVTSPYILDPLAENKEYRFIFRYIGDFENYDEIGDIQIESIFIDNTAMPFDINTGVNYQISPIKPIIINNSEGTYDSNHAGKEVIVASNGIYNVNVAGATLAKLTIQDGGQIKIQQPLTVTDLEVQKKIPTDKWTTFAVPANLIIGEMKLNNIDLFDNGTLAAYVGYTTPENQYWSNYTDSEIKQGTAIIISNAGSESIETFLNADASTTLQVPIKASNNLKNGNWFELKANPNWENLTIKGRAYVLNENGTSFDLQENPIIPPFQAYMVASNSMMDKVSSLRVGSIPTSNEQLGVSNFRAWGENGYVCFETTKTNHIAIYSITGTLKYINKHCVGKHRIPLPQGTYIVICDSTAIKIIVK